MEESLSVFGGQSSVLAAHLREVLSNHQLRQKPEEGSLEWARNFSWDRAAEEMIKLMEEVAQKG